MTAGAKGWRENWTLEQGEVKQRICHSNHSGIQLYASTTSLPTDHISPRGLSREPFDVYRDQVESAISQAHRRSVHRLRPIVIHETWTMFRRSSTVQ